MSTTTTNLIWAVTPRNARGRIHRATCKHLPKSAEVHETATADADALRGATVATCCSPNAADVEVAINEASTAAFIDDLTDPVEDDAPGDPAPKANGGRLPTFEGLVASVMAGAPPKESAHAYARAHRAARAAEGDAPAPKAAATAPVDQDGEQACRGACGRTLPARKFPTTRKPGVRGTECRECRDARYAAKRAAREAAAE